MQVVSNIGEGIERTDRALVAHFGRFNAVSFGLAIDALGRGALAIDGLVGQRCAIQQHALEATEFDIDVLDAALVLERLFVLTSFTGGQREQERAAKALRTLAIGMLELVGDRHAQSLVREGCHRVHGRAEYGHGH
jgi:hypothetical protein